MANASDTCGCCEGIEPMTPESIANRPGLSSLAYRIGTHSSFLETMLARLSSLKLASGGEDGEETWPLRALTTRDAEDPAIALLDAWATVADVLTFYQERIANEGFLHTAEERRSVLELARLIGYRLRPGVAASTWLALDLDTSYRTRLEPHAIKAQSVPGPDETPHAFENIEPLEARYEWNRLKPRLTQPQTLSSVLEGWGTTPSRPRLDIQGVTTDIKRGDAVLTTMGGVHQKLFHVAEVEKDAPADRTRLIFQEEAVLPLGAGYPIGASVIRALDAVAAAYTSEAARDKLDPACTETAVQVSNQVAAMRSDAEAIYKDAIEAEEAIAGHLEEIEVLKRHDEVREIKGLGAWLDDLTEELEAAITKLRHDAGCEKAVAFCEAVNPAGCNGHPDPNADPLLNVMQGLGKARSIPPRNAQSLERKQIRVFAHNADTGMQLTGALSPEIGSALPGALADVHATPDSTLRAYLFRASARPFGHNAAARPVVSFVVSNTGDNTGEELRNQSPDYQSYTTYVEWKLNDPLGAEQPNASTSNPTNSADDGSPPLHQAPDTLYLDAEYKVADTGWAVLEQPDSNGTLKRQFLDLKHDVLGVDQVSLTAYGISGKSTRIRLKDGLKENWLSPSATDLSAVRQVLVHCESEELTLAEEPIAGPIGAGSGSEWIELDGLYSGLQSGRWVLVSGDREDVLDETGSPVEKVAGSELAMLAEVIHGVRELPPDSRDAMPYGPGVLPGDRTHTFIKLAKPLAYSYRRDSLAIYGNVVKATHGETRTETLGAGDGAKTFQSFALKQTPLTYVASPTPAGAKSTLEVRVNGVRWHETEYLNDLGPADRGFVTKTGDEGKTSIVFGDGITGARLPTGLENVHAGYRSGIGEGGNVKAEQISQLVTRPLGVKAVINPLRASGGADREDRDTARENAPPTVTALDRLVSVSDYADFARTFAGIGKARSRIITDGRREWVQVTIAGADDIPIDETSDLYRNLLQALHDFGEPSRAVALQVREALLLMIGAKVRILADYLWDKVADAIRARLLDTFSFARRALGQDVIASEVISVIQAVEGVAWVDLDALGGLPEKKTDRDADGKLVRRLLTPRELAETATEFLAASASKAQPEPRLPVNLADFEGGAMRPAQIAYLTPEVADTLVLSQVAASSTER